MRLFKFRAWSTEYKQFLACDCSQLWNYMDGYANPVHRNLDWKTITVQQYTGFEDKNNKEIYEGDIVKSHGKLSMVNTICCWYSKNGCWCFRIKDDDESFHWYKSDFGEDIEIIGNIFENPDLL